MRASIKIFLSLLIVTSLFFQSCSTVPVTERRQLILIPDSQMLSMSFTQYDEFLKNNTVSSNSEKSSMVKKVGAKIQKAVEQYLTANGRGEELRNYAWEFNLIESDEINAWCMPGGKVVVYTGILSIAKDEDGLAVVMGHEIAHAIAKHGSERMSQGMIAQASSLILAQSMAEKPEATRKLWMGVFGAGAQFGVILPFSRYHESEADHLGLIFMSMAGYNPKSAVAFWQRMSRMKEGQAPPEFISTHPSDERRIRQIEEKLPKAMKYFNQ